MDSVTTYTYNPIPAPVDQETSGGGGSGSYCVVPYLYASYMRLRGGSSKGHNDAPISPHKKLKTISICVATSMPHSSPFKHHNPFIHPFPRAHFPLPNPKPNKSPLLPNIAPRRLRINLICGETSDVFTPLPPTPLVHSPTTNAQSSPPKAVLYTFNLSVWAAAAEWAVQEKGYGEDELEFRTVDVGEFVPLSFPPQADDLMSCIYVCSKGRILCAFVFENQPQGDDSNARCAVVEYIGCVSKTHTTSQKPAPVLSPATVEASGLSTTLINLVHSPEVDPNFLMITTKDEGELAEKSAGFVGKTFVLGRAKAMEEYLATEDLIPKIKKILEEKKAQQAPLVRLFSGQASKEEKEGYFAKSKGLSLADLHVGVWLARIVMLAAGEEAAKDLKKLPELLSTLAKPINSAEFKVGPKVTKFWNEIIARDGFKKVYEAGLH
ncbi:hypothetical protein AG1IA_05089 [Rhizoctonia solani AG-1 IA]|uniref:GST C-terminal domain-containing protein n=1 Tax=Thanatephorus cucumeris (strain AG1-IA) TaxID=983506 RepID=L8WRZ2_THACA|nr:hypothetical protein AG1IA_05089 [Rhizoctonia solani AG-1 IA]